MTEKKQKCKFCGGTGELDKGDGMEPCWSCQTLKCGKPVLYPGENGPYTCALPRGHITPCSRFPSDDPIHQPQRPVAKSKNNRKERV